MNILVQCNDKTDKLIHKKNCAKQSNFGDSLEILRGTIYFHRQLIFVDMWELCVYFLLCKK